MLNLLSTYLFIALLY